ncbi:RNA polymerase sigma factor [Planctomycetota bacterium]
MLEQKRLKHDLVSGEPGALERVYQAYLDDLLTLGVALCGDSALAEDAVQDVFVSLARRNGEFSLRGSLKAYLTTSVYNRIRDHFRASTRRRDRDAQLRTEEPQVMGIQERLVGTEEARRLNRALDTLPQEQRETVVLHLKADKRLSEIAKLQGVSANTVRGRYRYALQKLRQVLDGQVTL